MMSIGVQLEERKQANISIAFILVGVALLITGSLLGLSTSQLVLMYVLGVVLLSCGAFTLSIVLVGAAIRRTRKPIRQQPVISIISLSQSRYSDEDLKTSNFLYPEKVYQTHSEIAFISLPTCPKVVIPVQIQPPPSYEVVTSTNQK